MLSSTCFIALAHLEETGAYVRIMFFDFSSAFNTIQQNILKDKLTEMGVDLSFISWITDYLTGRPQYVRLGNCVSGTLMSSTGAPQGTVLAPFLFTLYTADFKYTSESCHIQKYSDDTAIVACIRNGQESEYRDLIKAFSDWSNENHLLLNTSKTKEMIIDFRRFKPPLQPVNTGGVDIEVVPSYKYLGVYLDNKLDWSLNTDALYKKGQSRLFFLRKLRSFNICSKMLQMFYQSVVASVLFYAAVCWGGSIRHRDARRLDRLVKRAGSVIGARLDTLEEVVERCTIKMFESIVNCPDHPLHNTIVDRRGSSGRLLSLRCRTERFKRSFAPTAIRLSNSRASRLTEFPLGDK